MIRLEPVTDGTFKRIVDMKLSPEQNKFVAPNVVSLAQAWLYYNEARPFAIMNDDEVVGFLMLDWDDNERTVGIWRFMIATEHQGKGFGRAAMEAAVALIREHCEIDLIHLDYVPGNEVARKLYYSLGFRENGDIEDGEIIMTLPLTDSPKLGMLTADDDDFDDIAELIEAKIAAGHEVCATLRDDELLHTALRGGEVTRFTIFGDTVGIAVNDELVMSDEHNELMEQAKIRLQKKRR